MAVPGEQMEGLDLGAASAPEDPAANAAKISAIRTQLGPDAITESEELILAEFFPKGKNASEHNANLAAHLDAGVVDKLGFDVYTWAITDKESMAEWFERESLGMTALGVAKYKLAGADFKGASKVTHPIFAEATVQFNARVMPEVWPVGGPVKVNIIGHFGEEESEEYKEVAAQAGRVAGYMNYQLTNEMSDAYEEMDKLTFRLPQSGSVFKKQTWDPEHRRRRSYTINATDFLVPYQATSLKTTPRMTEVLRYQPYTIERLMDDGYYRDTGQVHLKDADETASKDLTLHDVLDEANQTTDTSGIGSDDNDQRIAVLQCRVDLKLPGVNGETKENAKARPYVVDVDFESQTVLSIRRNWVKGDKYYRRLVPYTHYRFFPGHGFYGYGLYHMVGGLFESASGALRALLDSAAFSNLQGGFRSRDADLSGTNKDGEVPLSPGEFRQVEASSEELSKGILPLPYKEPSGTLFSLLGYLDDLGRKFTSTTETMVGDASRAMPVGTTMALIEQGDKVHTQIHARVHKALDAELKYQAWMNSVYLPLEGVGFMAGNKLARISRRDFDSRIDVNPVSSPKSTSGTVRMMQAQALVEQANASPDLYNRPAVQRRFLRALQVEDEEDLLRDPDNAKRRDCSEENIALTKGMAIKIFPDQDHQAHVQAHNSFLATLPQDLVQQYMPLFTAHIAEHMAHAHRLQISEATGMMLPPANIDGPATSAEEDNYVAQVVAEGVQLMAEKEAQLEPEKTPEQIEAEAKAQVLMQDAEVKAKIRTEEHEQKIQQASEAAALRQREEADRLDAAKRATQEKHDFELGKARELQAEKIRMDNEFAETSRRNEEKTASQKRINEQAAADRKRSQDSQAAGDKRRAEADKTAAKAAAVDRAEIEKEDRKTEMTSVSSRLEELLGSIKGLVDLPTKLDEMNNKIEEVATNQEELSSVIEERNTQAEARRGVVEEAIRKGGDDGTIAVLDKARKIA